MTGKQNSPSQEIRFPPRWLPLARWIWLLGAGFYLALYLLAWPSYLEQMKSLTGVALEVGAHDPWPAGELLPALDHAGISPSFFSMYYLIIELVSLLGFTALGLLIFLKRSDTFIGWYTALLLVTFGIGSGQVLPALIIEYPAFSGLVDLIIGMPWFVFYVFFFIYPDGRFVPRWTIFAALALLILIVWLSLAPGVSQLPFILLVFSAFSFAVYSQVYRFRRISNPLQRQQTKWLMSAIAFLFVDLLLSNLLFPITIPALGEYGRVLLLYDMGAVVWLELAFLLIPITLAVAILRYKLWDIDLIIRRTLIYGALSASLALIYLGGVVLMQSVLSALTGESRSEIVTVVTTLVIAALFTPLRKRIQHDIDRRFYRRKYNAEQALSAFAAQARQVTDLDELTGHVVGVVEQTIQPQHVSLWINPSNGNKA